MQRQRRGLSAAILLPLLAVLSCTDTAPGTFHVKFVWPNGPPTLTAPLYIFARVEERNVDVSTAGAVLALAGPVSYDGHGARLDFGSVPHGKNRTVVIELHETSSTASQVIYYGLSERFSFGAGDDVEVPVMLTLKPAPGVTPPGGTPPTSSIAIEAPVTPGYVKSPAVDLVLASDTGVTVKIANRLSGIESAAAVSVANLEAVEGQANAHRLREWNVNDGLADSACALQDGCQRTVFAQFADPNGYVSPVVSAQVVLDTTPPALLHPRANPSAAKAGDTIVFSLEPNETLSTAPVPTVSPLDGQEAVTLQYEEGTRYIFTHTVADGEPDGRFTATFALTDLAGNVATASPDPPVDFQVDSHIPRISNLATSAVRYSGIAGHNVVSVSFDVTESVDGAGSALVVLVAGQRSTCSAFQSSSPSYSCTYAVPAAGTSGTKAITVTTQDAAHNTDYASTSVVFDYAAPSVVSSLASPALAGLGQEESLLFVVNKALGAEPVLTVTGPRTLVFTGTASGTSFTFQTLIPSNDTSGAYVGTYSSTLSLVDDVGNVATGLAGPTFLVDTEAPVLANVQTLNGAGRPASRFSTATGFDTLLVAFDVSKDVPQASVTIGPLVVTNCAPSPAGTHHLVCTHLVDGTEPETALPISVQVTDAAGNTASAGTTATFDFTAPTLVSPLANPPLVGLGRTETVSFTASEALVATPAPRVTRDGVLTFFTNASGTAYAYATTIPTSDPDNLLSGSYATSFVLTDLAGNSATRDGPGFVIDSVAPVLSDLYVTDHQSQLASRFSTAIGYDTIRVAFRTSKPLPGARLFIAREEAATCVPFADGSSDYVCEYQVTGEEPETNVPISVQVTDEAGNAASLESVVTFDFTPPSLIPPSLASPSVAGLNSRETLRVTASEPLQNDPALALVGSSGPLQFSSLASGTTYFYTATIPATDPTNEFTGSYLSQLTMVDLAGNQGVVSGPAFQVDTQPPAITNLVTLNAAGEPATAFSAKAGFNTLGVAFDVSKAISSVSVNAGATSFTNCAQAPTGSHHFTCSYQLTGAESEATNTLTVTVADAAGNNARGETAITLDFTAPSLVWQSATPPLVGLGQRESLQVSASEPLGASPTLAISGPAELPFSQSVSGATYIFQSLLPTSDPPGTLTGSYTTTLTLTDVVGNMRRVDGPAFAVDTVAPVIANVRTLAMTGDPATRFSAQPGFDRVVVRFDWSSWQGAALSSLSVLMGASQMDCAQEATGTSTLEVTCLRAVDGTEPEGALPVTIQAADAAGNRATGSATVTLDFTPPVIQAQTASPAVAHLGASETLVISLDEQLGETPELAVVGPGSLPFTAESAGTTCTFRANVPAADPTNAYSGSYTTQLAVTDLVGNTAVLTGPDFAVDAFPPTISQVVKSASLFSAVPAHNQVILSFNAAESLDSAGGSLSVTISGVAMQCGPYQAAAPNYSCSYDVTGHEAEGPQPILISASDAAGNTAGATTTVTFDFTAPTLFSQTASAPDVGLNERELLTLTPNESLTATPVVTVTGPEGAVPFTFLPGTSYSFETTMQLAGASTAGTYRSRVAMTDLAGNSAAVDGPSFVYDPIVPTISNLQTNATVFSQSSSHNEVVVTFIAAKSLDGAGARLSVTVGGNAMRCDPFKAANSSYTCRYTVTGAELDGPQTVVVSAQDAAGNAGSRTSTVTFDFTAPTVVTLSASPSLAGVGQVESLLITANEPLAAAPIVDVGGPSGTLSFSYLTGSAWTFTSTIQSTTPSGAYTSSISLTDTVGNATTITGPTFNVDSVIPTLTNLKVTGGHQGRIFSAQPAFRHVSIAFDSPKALAGVGSTLSVTVGGEAGECSSWQAMSPNYTCSYVVTGEEAEGTQSISLSARDAAGNSASAATTVVFDFTAPVLATASASPAVVGLGQQESLTVSANETLVAEPTLAVASATDTLEFDLIDGTSWSYQRTLGPTDASGSYATRLSMTDLVGNAATVPGPSFVVDTGRPLVTNVAVTGGYQGRIFSTRNGFNQMTATFDVPESLDGAGAGLLVGVSGERMTCGPWQAQSPSYTCAYAVTSTVGEGARPIIIQTKDAAGNVGNATVTVSFDFTMPTLLSPSVAPGVVGVGQSESLYLTVSETLAAPPSLLVRGAGTLSFVPIVGTTYAYQRTITSGDPSGVYAPTLTMVDLVGNEAQVEGPSFEVDAVVPTISNVRTNGVLFSAKSGHNSLVVTFDTAESVDTSGSTLSVSVGGQAISCGAWSATTPSYTCTYPIAGTETDGAQAVVIETSDAAGNHDSKTVSVIFDFTAPSLVSKGASPALAGVGATEGVALTANEPLSATPVLVVSDGAHPLSFQFLTGSSYIFQRTIAAADVSGDYTSTVTLTDQVGNQATVPGPSFSLDTNIPTISHLASNLASYSAKSAYRSATVTFDTTKSLDAPGNSVTATFAGFSMNCGPFNATAPSYTCTYAVNGTEAEGPEPIAVVTRDRAGNSDRKLLNVVLDFTAPTLVSSSAAPALAGVGTIESLSLTASEPLTAAPTFTVTSPIGGSLTLPLLAGSTYVFQGSITAANPAGTYTSSAVLTDLVGNTATVAGPSFVVDSVVPAISNLQTTTGAVYSAKAGFRVVTATFNTAERMDIAGNVLTVTVAGQPMSCSANTATPPKYTCNYTVTGSEGAGVQPIIVSTSDAAGNSDTKTIPITLDFTAPTLAASSASPSLAAVGTVESLSFTPSEALQSTPVLTVTDGTPPLAFVPLAGSAYTFQRTIVAADFSGTYTSSIKLTDQVGNFATVTGPSFTVDAVIPTINNLSANRATYSAVAAGPLGRFNDVTVTFNAAESAATLTVTFAGQTMSCGAYQATAPNYTCTYTVLGAESEGVQPIVVRTQDSAGNSDTKALPVELDFTAPKLSAAGAAPSLAAIGTVESLSLSPSETLGAAPIVSVTGPAGATLVFSLLSGSAYTYQRTISGVTDASGTYNSSITLTDAVGNRATVAGPSFDVDTVAPTITNLLTNKTLYSTQTGHRNLQATFDVTKSLDVTGGSVSATVGARTLNCDAYSATSPNYTCHIQVDGTEGEGPQTLSVTTQDRAGNSDTALAVVTFDFTGPTLVSATAAPPLAGVGTIESVSLTTNEPLEGAPTLTLSGPGGSTLSLSPLAGSTYVFQGAITTAVASGIYSSSASMTDLAGNTAEVTGPSFVVDSIVPTISALSTDAQVYSAQTGFKRVTATFNTAGSVDVSGSTLTATVAGVAMNCDPYSATAPNYTCRHTFDGTEAEGVQPLTVTTTDSAGNSDTKTIPITLDFTAPTLAASSAAPALVAVGTIESVTFTPSEALRSTPTLTVTDGTHPLSFSLLSGSAYTFQRTIQSTDVSGTYGSSVVLVDTVGNSRTVTGPSFALDTVLPTISNATTSRTVYSAVNGGPAGNKFNAAKVTFDTAKSLDVSGASVTATFAGRNMPCGTRSSSSPNYTCTTTVSGADPAGVQSVVIRTVDAAGNTDSKVLSVTLDFTAPTLVAQSAGPSLAGVGAIESISLTPNEALASAPTFAAASSGHSMSFTLVGGSAYTFQHTVTSGDFSGSYATTVSLTDLVGNVRSGVAGPSFSVDAAPPVLSNLALNRNRYSAVTGFRTVRVTLDSSKVLSSLTASLGASCPALTNSVCALVCGAYSSTSPNYTCALTLDGTEQTADGKNISDLPEVTAPVTVTGTDSAGNAVSQSLSATLDFQAPSLASSSANPSLVGDQSSLFLFLTPSESLSDTPTVTATGNVSGSVFTPSFVNGSQYTFKKLICAGCQTEDSYTTSVSMTDLVGNTASLLAGPSFQIDTSRITVSSITLNNTLFSQVNGFDELQASFTLSEAPASLSVVISGATTIFNMSCSTPDSLAYTCTRTIGSAWNGETGANITVLATDAAGNQAVKAATVGFDFTTPALSATPSVTYVPGSGNVLTSVSAARVGTTVQVAFTTTERLSADPTVTLNQSGTALTKVSAVGTSYIYSLTVASGNPPDRSSYSLDVSLTDLVGNNTTVPVVPGPKIVVDTAVPGTPDTSIASDLVTYTRIPWGDNATGGVSTFSVAGLAGAVDGNSTVIVTDGPNLATANELGRDTAGSAGAFSVSLARADHPTVYVTAVDNAGNTSPAATVREVVWKATFGGKTKGKTFKNPHLLEAATDFNVRNLTAAGVADGPLAQRAGYASEVSDYAGSVTPSDGSTVTVQASPMTWTEASASSSPGSGGYHGLAYDAARGVTVVYGGVSGFSDVGDLYEWDGASWTKPEVTGSTPLRDNFNLVYDSVMGGTVLYGGQFGGTTTVFASMMLWDGAAWSQVPQVGLWPTGRYGAQLAYDATRGVLVLFGGRTTWSSTAAVSDTWEFDGAEWTQITPAGSVPPARAFGGMAYDAARGVTVLFGGRDSSDAVLNTTWEWNGASWTERTLGTGNPVARSHAGFAFDASRGVTVLFGGEDAASAFLADTWEWNGTTWTQRSPAVAATGRVDPAMTYDGANQVVVMFGGNDGSKLSDSWTYDGSLWVNATPSSSAPSSRSGTALAYDAARHLSVLFGGRDSSGLKGDTWVWNSARWKQLSPAASPSAREGFVLVYDSFRSAVFLFGGTDASGDRNDTWKWNGTAWTDVTPTAFANPGGGSKWAATYDSSRHRIVLIGPGATDADVWEWNGVRWTQLAISGDVPNFSFDPPYAIAYDANRDKVVFWGSGTALMWEWDRATLAWTSIGYGPVGAVRGGVMLYDSDREVVFRTGGSHDAIAYDDAWEYDGNAWTEITGTGPRPDPRQYLAAAFDTDRKRVTLFGGKTTSGSLLGDTWTGTVGTSRRAAALAQFNFSAAGASEPILESMTINVRAGAAGNTKGTSGRGVSTPGTTLLVWDRLHGLWTSLDTNSSDTSSPSTLNHTTTSASEAARYVSGAADNEQISVAAMSTKSVGNGTNAPQVALDAAEVTVTYRQTQELCDTSPCVCGAGETVCSNTICVDTSVDLGNCGSCGNACTGTQACLSGGCQ